MAPPLYDKLIVFRAKYDSAPPPPLFRLFAGTDILPVRTVRADTNSVPPLQQDKKKAPFGAFFVHHQIAPNSSNTRL